MLSNRAALRQRRTKDAALDWTPEFTFAERLKMTAIPPGLRIRQIYGREMRRGEREIRLIPFLARADRISIDVGANKGVYSYALLRRSVEVWAFEANPKMFTMLERWARPAGVRLFREALDDSDGEASLMIPRGSGGYSNQGASLAASRVSGRDYATVTVPVRRLDTLDPPPVGFIKIDVEGHEQAVLAGAAGVLERDRPTLLVEIEQAHVGRPIEEMIAEVEAYGYRAFAMARDTLTPLDRIDLDAHHGNAQSREDYVFNFIFFPA